MSTTHFANRTFSSDQTAVEAMCNAIVEGESDEDLFAMFLETDTFKDVVLNWKHPSLNINIFQFAILYDRNVLVQFLGLRCPGFHNERERYLFPSQTPGDDEAQILVNCPLHLVCWIGSLEMLTYLLTCNSNFSLKDVSVLMLKKQVALNNGKENTLFERSIDPLKQRKKPFEVCIAERHLDCAVYLMNYFSIPCQSFAYLYAGLDDQSSLLHKACSIGCGPLVLLLLETESESAIHLTDHTGKTPLHIAVWNGDTESISHLLQHGANPNVVCKSKSCLHIMYRSHFNIPKYVQNTALLIKYGINVKLVDDAGNSVLHVLAELLQINISLIKMLRRAVYASRELTTVCTSVIDYTLDMYHKDITECFRLLISSGADPNIRNSKGDIAFEILASITGFSSGLNEPLIYKAAEMLLEHESTIVWSTFISTHLMHRSGRKDKVKLVALLCQHGGDVDQQESTEDVLTELCYPVLFSIQKRVDVPCVQLMLNYMSPGHLRNAMNSICGTVLPQLLSKVTVDADYVEQLAALASAMQVRSLRHSCKVSVLVCLRRRSERCRRLPLPKFLKDYIMSSEF